MYTIITNTGDYRTISANSKLEAESIMYLIYTDEEIKALEAEIMEEV